MFARSQDVKADVSVAVDVRVHGRLGQKYHFGRLHRIPVREAQSEPVVTEDKELGVCPHHVLHPCH